LSEQYSEEIFKNSLIAIGFIAKKENAIKTTICLQTDVLDRK